MKIHCNILLIIGNGFDLDLGLKTGYSEFIKSKFFTPSTGLSQYLKEKYQIQNWIDLENELKSYIEELKERLIRTAYYRNDKEKQDVLNNKLIDHKESIASDYYKLIKNLMSYLNSLNYEIINKNSYAASLISILSKINGLSAITFNYTNLKEISNLLNSPLVSPKHVHGSLKESDIILGFEDNVDVNDNLCFMIKSHSPHFRSCNIRDSLEKADEIIFFGHSLGMTDYHYFEDFFLKQSGAMGSSDIKKKRIRIFTYDENSRQEILIQLRTMNNKRINELYDLNDFAIYRTKNKIDDNKIKQYFSELRKYTEEIDESLLLI